MLGREEIDCVLAVLSNYGFRLLTLRLVILLVSNLFEEFVIFDGVFFKSGNLGPVDLVENFQLFESITTLFFTLWKYILKFSY